MGDLKLVALDADDLAVISAHVQDAVLQVGDLAYIPAEHRFAAIANRFDWAAAAGAEGLPPSLERRRTALRFDRVLEAKLQGIDLKTKRQVLELLAIRFDETEPPGGFVTLVFAGGAAIRLKVECIEGEMRDMGAAWKASRRPAHPEAGTAPES
ncbi:MAG: DUF2948 family protein [Hyphomicrobiaceae bacterium]|nr:DUF2948 family protein [Hyphomicrobiaceae bacterium]